MCATGSSSLSVPVRCSLFVALAWIGCVGESERPMIGWVCRRGDGLAKVLVFSGFEELSVSASQKSIVAALAFDSICGENLAGGALESCGTVVSCKRGLAAGAMLAGPVASHVAS